MAEKSKTVPPETSEIEEATKKLSELSTTKPKTSHSKSASKQSGKSASTSAKTPNIPEKDDEMAEKSKTVAPDTSDIEDATQKISELSITKPKTSHSKSTGKHSGKSASARAKAPSIPGKDASSSTSASGSKKGDEDTSITESFQVCTVNWGTGGGTGISTNVREGGVWQCIQNQRPGLVLNQEVTTARPGLLRENRGHDYTISAFNIVFPNSNIGIFYRKEAFTSHTRFILPVVTQGLIGKAETIFGPTEDNSYSQCAPYAYTVIKRSRLLLLKQATGAKRTGHRYILAVTWHGPHNGYSNIRKKKLFKLLQEYIKLISTKILEDKLIDRATLHVIIGGDFNVDLINIVKEEDYVAGFSKVSDYRYTPNIRANANMIDGFIGATFRRSNQEITPISFTDPWHPYTDDCLEEKGLDHDPICATVLL